MSTCLTTAEFEAQFGALHDRIFRRFDDGKVFDDGFFPSGFVNPDWQVVLLCKRIGFAACDIEDGEEHNPDFPNEYEILLDVLAGKGVQEVVVTSARTMTLEMSSFVCRPDIDTVREGFVACDVWCAKLSIFDRTGLWGLFSHYDNYGVLGAAPEIMVPYIEKAGGLETIKHRFKAWAESYPERELLGSNLCRLYDLAGWHDVKIEREPSPAAVDGRSSGARERATTKCLTEAEFEAQFGALHDRIFRRSKWGTVFHEGPFPTGFVNPDWHVVLLWSGISSAGYIPEIGEEYDPNFPDEYEILLDVLAEKGVEEVVVTSARGISGPGMSSFICRPDIDTVREGFDICGVWVEGVSIFDRTGSWGLVSEYDNYGVLGGAPEIMEPYIEKAGGLETIKHRFSEWAESYPDGEWLGSELRRLYDLVGWHDVTVERVT